MDRKGIIAVTLSILTLIGWAIWTNKDMQKVAAAQAEMAKVKAAAAEAEAKAKPPEPATLPQTPGKPAEAAAAPSEPAQPEKIETLQGPSADYAFSNLGGGIASATLKTHEAERGTRMVLNEFGSIPIGAITEAAEKDDKKTRFPFSNEADVEARLPFSVNMDSASGTATFERTDSREVQITKKFTIPKSKDLDKDYIATLEVTFANHGALPVGMRGYYVYTGSAAPVHQLDQQRYTVFTWAEGKFLDPSSFASGWFSGPEKPFITASQEGIAWAAVADQYFTTMVMPQVTDPDAAAPLRQRGSGVWSRRFAINDTAWQGSGRATEGSTAQRWAMDGALGMPAPAGTLEPGKSVTQKFRIYAGPREYGRLRLLPDAEYKVINYGMFATIIGPVSNLLLVSMNWLHGVVGSYAWSIVILTLVIKCILWPMQNKATQSMKRMQLLTPKMTELKEKYKDDPARMNTEVMKLYKTYGVNPLGGCLPMFIQLPVFWGFYSVLGTAVELRNSTFFWVHDLSQPDTVFHLPGLGYPVNVLPLVMAVTMFWQMKVSPKSGDPSQQKMFMFMPLIFIAFCYNYASALALYLTVQNLFSVLQLYVTRNQSPPTLQKIDRAIEEKIARPFPMSLNPRDTLDTMLGLLGFVCEVKEFEREHGLTLMVYTAEADRLIGRNGALLEDTQLLLNRVLLARDKHASKVQVDIEHWREMKDDGLAQRVKQIAEIVRHSGRPYHLEPMNAYERRIVHNAFKDDPEIMTWSPPDDARLKRITLRKRPQAPEA